MMGDWRVTETQKWVLTSRFTVVIRSANVTNETINSSASDGVQEAPDGWTRMNEDRGESRRRRGSEVKAWKWRR